MKTKILISLLISFVYSSSYGQFNKLTLKSTNENKRVCIKRNHGITILVDSTKYEGKISDIAKDSIEIRIYGRNPDKVEYDSVPLNNSDYDKHLKQGWYCQPEPSYIYHNDFINSDIDKKRIRVFFRSTEFEKISFKDIDYFQYKKTERTDGPGMELLAAGIGLITSPIWLNTGEKPDWTLFFVCAGIVTIDVTFTLIQKRRQKVRNYKFNEWKIKKIK